MELAQLGGVAPSVGVHSIQGISEKMLAQTLRALVQDGLVWREVKPTTPPQVTYGLTEFGQEG